MEKTGNDILNPNSLTALSPKQRMDYIVSHPKAIQLVQQIPPQDLFLTIKEVGLTDASELVEMASQDQMQTFLDLDGWHKNQLDPEQTANWLGTLAEANPSKAIKVFCNLDLEFISLLFKLYTQVFDRNAGEEPNDLGTTQSISPDGHYVVVFHANPEEKNLVMFLKQTLESLYQRDMKFALRLIESTRWETPSILEEESLRWREARLQDLGFAPLAEAKQILGFIDPYKINITHESPYKCSASSPATSLLLSSFTSENLFSNALRRLSETEQKHMSHQLVSVINQVHLSLNFDFGNISALKDSAIYTSNMLEVALAFLSKGDENILGKLLLKLPIKKLFQIGRSLILKIKRDFKKVIQDPNSALLGEGLLRLDSPLAEVSAGLMQPDPLFFAGLKDPKRLDFRRFEGLADVALTAKTISEATFRSYLTGPLGLKVSDETINALKLNEKEKKPTHGVFLATWLMNLLLDSKPSLTPLDKKSIEKLITRFEDKKFTSSDINACVKATQNIALALVPRPGIKTEQDAFKRSENYVKTVLSIAAHELCDIQSVETKLIKSLLTVNGDIEQ